MYARYMYLPGTTKIKYPLWGSVSEDGKYLFFMTETSYCALLILRVSDGNLLSNFMISHKDMQVDIMFNILRIRYKSIDKVYILAFSWYNSGAYIF